MNRFGPALEEALARHHIGKTEFASACGIDRNQLTNIINGRTRSPTKIDSIFTTLRHLTPRRECLTLAVAFLEDRRGDITYSSTDIDITATHGQRNHRRERLISLYDSDPNIRAALDTITDSILADAPPALAARAAEPPDTYAAPPTKPYAAKKSKCPAERKPHEH